MAIQMIFCLETNKRAGTDYIYIKEILDNWYQLSNQVKLTPIYMGTKTKYQSKDILREISQKKRDYIQGETKVIYCIDTDEYEKSFEHKNAFQKIRQFCKKNQSELIWFCHDVEEVFIGERVSDSQKVQKAGEFRSKKKIGKLSQERLSEAELKPCASNILRVLDQYLERK